MPEIIMPDIAVEPRNPTPRRRPRRRPIRPLLASSRRFLALLGCLAVCWGFVGCSTGKDDGAATVVAKTSATERAERRLFDGAPPVIPHDPLGAACGSCHNAEGVEVPDLGYAPPSPHGPDWGDAAQTAGLSAISRCRQCHVFQRTEEVFVANTFAGLRQDLRRGRRLNALAPPVIPHRIFMREACLACHDGPAAREAIRTSHPERVRCLQCHLEQNLTTPFDRRSGGASASGAPGAAAPRSTP